MKEINHASRILRVGNEFSDVNQKLKDSVHAFLVWLTPIIQWEALPEGWRADGYGNGAWGLGFLSNSGGWVTVRSDGVNVSINHYLAFCQALAGPEGAVLIEWLEQQTRERNQLREQFAAKCQGLLQALS
jgi:hypothetical protein